jgi:hypothetical protein
VLGAVDVEAWEAEHGRIPVGAAVLRCTGWDEHVDDPARYLGDPLAFPGYGADAAALLVERRVAGLGIDTLSVDAGAAADFPVHFMSLPAGLWHLEGLVGLGAVPDTGATGGGRRAAPAACLRTLARGARPASLGSSARRPGLASYHDRDGEHDDRRAGRSDAGHRLVEDQVAEYDRHHRVHVGVGRDARDRGVLQQPRVGGESEPDPITVR